MLALLVALLVAVASAWEATAVAADGALRPGEAALVWVAVPDEAGQPGRRPELVADGAHILPILRASSPGVWAFAVVAPVGVRELPLTISGAGGWSVVKLPVLALPVSRLRLGEGAGESRERTASFVVQVTGLPPERLRVALSEGEVVAVRPHVLGLRVDVALGSRTLPRWLVVGVWDAERAELPSWGRIPVRTRTVVPIFTEPGAQVTVEVGGERVGPARADDKGEARLAFDHQPGHDGGRVTVRDPAGNEISRPLGLEVNSSPSLAMFVQGQLRPEGLAPAVRVRVSEADGGPWNGPPPACRTPRQAELAVTRLAAGLWTVQVPPERLAEPFELRIRCTLDGRQEVEVPVPAAADHPVRLGVRAWPEVLSPDFPVADLLLWLENTAGERVSATGRFVVDAGLGSVEVEPPSGATVRATYRSELAAEVGEDEVDVRWYGPAGEGAAREVSVLGLDVPAEGVAGVARLAVRALDGRRRPLANRAVSVRADGAASQGQTDEAGWARVAVPVSGVDGPVVLAVEADGATFQALVRRGDRIGPEGLPPDLRAHWTVRVQRGRVAQVRVEVEPAVLRPGTRTGAVVTARFEDRDGNPATVGLPELATDGGRLERLEATAPGEARWRLLPPRGFAEREIALVARNSVLDVEGTANLVVRPKPIDGYLGAGGGIVTNFGALVTPFLSIDGGVRLRLRRMEDEDRLSRTRLFLLPGLAYYAERAEVGVDDEALDVRMAVLPLRLQLALRQEQPSWSFTVAVGSEVAPWWGRLASADGVLMRRSGVLSPALTGDIGLAVRVPSGEIAVSLRGSTLNSRGTEASFAGPVSGLSALVGYRVVF